MAGHGLMWSSMYRPEKPEVKRRVDWKRIGALFAPYWRQQAMVLACIVVASAIGLAPGFITARIIDSAIPHRDVASSRSTSGSSCVGVDRGRHRRRSRLSQLGRRRRHHARHPHEPRRAPASDAALVLHRNEDRRDHEPRQQRRRQHRQRRDRHADHDRHQHRDDRHDARRDVRLELAAWRCSRSSSFR